MFSDVVGKVNVKFNLGGFFSKKFLAFISLLFMVVLVSSSFISVGAGVVLVVSDVVVGDGVGLLKAVGDAPDNVEYVIGLGADVVLEKPLEISAGKSITLVSVDGFWSLFGANKQNTIVVEGLLSIDGIGVTHVDGGTGGGVYVKEGGTLVLLSGKIFGNTNTDDYGGGVHNQGAFTLLGGEISGNTASLGGGVINDGVFVMSGGIITNNAAGWGGGVYNTVTFKGHTFTMTGGKIIGNTATNNGGGVYYYKGSFKWWGGKISDNAADYKNDDVCRANVSITADPPIRESFWTDSGVWLWKIRNSLFLPVIVIVVGIAVMVGLLFYRIKKKRGDKDFS